MRIAIIGLGIGGAAAGASMVRRGLDVKIFEQASEIREVGAGVATWPNTIRLLNRLGLGDTLQEIGVRNGNNPIRDAAGHLLHYVSVATFDDAPGYYLHRAELLEAIAQLIPPSRVQLDSRCASVRQVGDQVLVELVSGETEAFDVVIGADGIHSTVIRAVTEVSPPTYSNLAAYRGLIPNDSMLGIEKGTIWTDQHKYFVAFPVSGGRFINFVGVVPTASRPDESWFMSGNKEALEAEYSDWDPVVRSIIAKVRETFRWGLYFREPLRRIVKGRIALIGDAAHPMLIHAGQGVGQALEDGVALAAILDGADAGSVENRLRLFEDLRLKRATDVQTLSRRNAQFLHREFPLKPEEERPDQQGQIDWILNYDVELEAERLVRDHPG